MISEAPNTRNECSFESPPVDQLYRRIAKSGMPPFVAARLKRKLDSLDVSQMSPRRSRALQRRLIALENLGLRYRAARSGVSAVMHSVRMVHTTSSRSRRHNRSLDVEDSLVMLEDAMIRQILRLGRPW